VYFGGYCFKGYSNIFIGFLFQHFIQAFKTIKQ
jgi:hypothetical protein